MVIRRLVLVLGASVMLCSTGCLHRCWCSRPACSPCCSPAPSCCESSFAPMRGAPPMAGPGPLMPVPAKATVQIYEGR
jgi:hypothetical protein